MFTYFMRNRRGSITIMLSVILIAVLSLSTTLMETARYRSLERLYKEIEESAAFSVLSEYDRDLYSNFGLMAISPDTGKEQMLSYLKTNLNENMADGNGVDVMLTILEDEVSVDKLYDLAQDEVFRMQVNEFCAYRAPVSIIDNSLNIEETIQSLIKDLEDSMPLLKLFQNICGVADKIVSTFIKMSDYVDSAESLRGACDAYKNKVGSYNAAVSDRDSYMNDHEVDEEGYEDKLEALNEQVTENAAELKEKIVDLQAKLKDYYTKYSAFVSGFDAMQSANVKAIIQASTADASKIENEEVKKNTLSMINEMKDAYDDSTSLCNRLIKAMDYYTDQDIQNSWDDLSEQAEEISKPAETLQEISLLRIAQDNWLMTAVRLTASTIAQIASIVESWAEAINAIGEIITAFEIISTCGEYDPKYDNTISDSNFVNLPGRQYNGSGLVNAFSPYEGEDGERKNSQIEKTKEVAGSVGFDINILNTADNLSENVLLQNAMQRVKNAEEKFRVKCDELDYAFGIIGTLMAIGEMIGCLAELIDSLVELVEIFIQVVDTGELMKILYQRVGAATYANEMFTNRATEDGDKRLNQSSFQDNYRPGNSGDCFDKAETEYILSGSASERENQIEAFECMLMIRMLCNVPVWLSDQVFMEIVMGLCSTVVGFIVAFILVLLVIIIEAWMDMIILSYTSGGVDFIKTHGYFALDGSGLEELGKKVKDISRNLSKALSNGEKKLDESFAQKYVNGLNTWTYKDHMYLLLLLFVSTGKMYARSADLIEMDMNQIYRKKGKEFKLQDMATCIRVESQVYYQPLLPIPVISGLNDEWLKIYNLHYSTY